MHALKYAHFSLFQGIITLLNLIFIFVVFNCYHGISITLHIGMLPQMEQKNLAKFHVNRTHGHNSVLQCLLKCLIHI